jgi:hypothetical protein
MCVRECVCVCVCVCVRVRACVCSQQTPRGRRRSCSAHARTRARGCTASRPGCPPHAGQHSPSTAAPSPLMMGGTICCSGLGTTLGGSPPAAAAKPRTLVALLMALLMALLCCCCCATCATCACGCAVDSVPLTAAAAAAASARAVPGATWEAAGGDTRACCGRRTRHATRAGPVCAKGARRTVSLQKTTRARRVGPQAWLCHCGLGWAQGAGGSLRASQTLPQPRSHAVPRAATRHANAVQRNRRGCGCEHAAPSTHARAPTRTHRREPCITRHLNGSAVLRGCRRGACPHATAGSRACCCHNTWPQPCH